AKLPLLSLPTVLAWAFGRTMTPAWIGETISERNTAVVVNGRVGFIGLEQFTPSPGGAGRKKASAIIAMAHSLLLLVYQVIQTNKPDSAMTGRVAEAAFDPPLHRAAKEVGIAIQTVARPPFQARGSPASRAKPVSKTHRSRIGLFSGLQRL